MAYYTRFALRIINENDLFIPLLRLEYENAACALNDEGNTNNYCKWYDHEADMKNFSRKHPEIVFELEGNGENNSDMWLKYFKDGKMQVCQAKFEFDPYDESKLAG